VSPATTKTRSWRRLAFGLVLLVSSCAAVPPAVRETPVGIVYARNEVLAEQGAAALEKHDARIRALLGTSRYPPVIEVGWTRSDREKLAAFTSEQRIVVQHEWAGAASNPGVVEELVVHELLHWHATGPWDGLPYVVEEALVQLLTRLLVTEKLPLLQPPRLATLERALSIDQAGYFDCELETKGELELAALWFVEGLGMDPLKALTARATAEGLESIPVEWLLEECPPIEKGVIGLAWFRHLQELEPARGSK
jgi:hypothetical protein